MNLAGWVEKWGRAAGERTAIAFGAAPYASYRQWAARSRVLAGNLRALCRPDDRVAIAMTNRPEFLEALFAIWHAGLVAVPMNAKLHADELGYIIGHAQASSDPGEPRPRRGRRAAWPHRRHRQRRMAPPRPRRRHRYGGAASRRSRLAVLYQRHHRPAQGRDAHASQSDGDDAGLSVRHRAGRRSRRQNSSGAAVARLRTLRAALRRHGREECRAGIGRLRSRRDRSAVGGAWQCQLLRRADHGQPAGQPFGLCRRRSSRLAHHRLWRRPDACGKSAAGHGAARDRNSRKSTARAKRR